MENEHFRPVLSRCGKQVVWLYKKGEFTYLDQVILENKDTTTTKIPEGYIVKNIFPLWDGCVIFEFDIKGNETINLFIFDGVNWSEIRVKDKQDIKFITASNDQDLNLVFSYKNINGRRKFYKYLLSDNSYTDLRGVTGNATNVYVNEFGEPIIYEIYGDNDCIELRRVSDSSLLIRIPFEDSLSFRVQGIYKNKIYLIVPLGDFGSKLVSFSTEVDEIPTILYRQKKGSISSLVCQHDCPQYLIVEKQRYHVIGLSEQSQRILKRIKEKIHGDFIVIQSTDEYLLIEQSHLVMGTGWYLYKVNGDDFFPLNGVHYHKKHVRYATSLIKVKASDKSIIPGYVSFDRETMLNSRLSGKEMPTVVLIHGGPWRRVSWCWDAKRVVLLQLGCVVVEPNYRGSTGFGVKHVNAGNHEWGKLMRTDIEDVIEWCIDKQYTSPNQIILMGGSYGGFAALNLLKQSKYPYLCAIATSPVTDVRHFINNIPSKWKIAKNLITRRVNADASIIDDNMKIEPPILLSHGKLDSRLSAKCTANFFMSICRENKRSEFYLFTNEGHTIVREKNKAYLMFEISQFISKWVGNQNLVIRKAEKPDSCKKFLIPAQ